jgi:hypothetical protein
MGEQCQRSKLLDIFTQGSLYAADVLIIGDQCRERMW